MANDLFVRADRMLVRGALVPAVLHARDGVIVDVGDLTPPAGADVLDAGDEVVLPGLVDAHVHLNEPGRTEWEGFATATAAAAAGGVTTLVDMPLNSIPPTTTVDALQQKTDAARGRVHVDVGFWGGAIPGNASELKKLLGAGALGFKCFMVESGVDEFPYVREPDLRRAMSELAETGAPLLCHAELPGPIEAAARTAAAASARAYTTYLRSRPPAAEDEAIALLIALCRETGARVHVVHLSSAGSLAQIRAAKDAGLRFSAETTPHYLHFVAEDVPDGATAFKCAPPIRERDNRERLWQGLAEGIVEQVVSDHSPCTPELKRLEAGDFQAAWGGIASLQLGLPVIWTEARRRGHDLAAVSRWMSEAPARLAGLSHRKGTLERGKDADFVLFRPDEDRTIEAKAIRHRHRITPYLGEKVTGAVVATYVRGQKVYGDNEDTETERTPRGTLLLGERA